MFYVSLNVNFRKIRPGPAKQADTGSSQTRIWVTGGGALETQAQNDSGHPRLGANCLSNICAV